jgi:hypothetical protein
LLGGVHLAVYHDDGLGSNLGGEAEKLIQRPIPAWSARTFALIPRVAIPAAGFPVVVVGSQAAKAGHPRTGVTQHGGDTGITAIVDSDANP